jgi:hypothetical protein
VRRKIKHARPTNCKRPTKPNIENLFHINDTIEEYVYSVCTCMYIHTYMITYIHVHELSGCMGTLLGMGMFMYVKLHVVYVVYRYKVQSTKDGV